MHAGIVKNFLALIVLIAIAPACGREPTAVGTARTTAAQPAALISGFEENRFISLDFPEPTTMEFAPDGRLFVADQRGNLRVVKNGVLLPTPFLTLPVEGSLEFGLLGIAFAPNDAAHVFVFYTPDRK